MPDRHLQRIRDIFVRARALPEEARVDFLTRACEGDEELRGEIADLLSRDGQTGVFLDPSGIRDALARAITPLSLAAGEPHPARIAAYDILGILGEGGMGIVYEARQVETDRIVALKVMKIRETGSSIDHDRLFQHEIRSLARLNHPGIATLFEAGRDEQGRSFFAMEPVRGVPLDRHLASTPFPNRGRGEWLRHRLELFLRICETVIFAHQRGVIHRDLKPSNIYVAANDGDAPMIKVLDFGLARLTDVDITVASMDSEAWHLQGTLAYMSPEQARGNPHDVDFRSDIYALGVMLYEMLTGERPYDVRLRTIPQAVRVICEEIPVRPRRKQPALPQDVDTVVSTALAKDPDLRYQSTADLAGDIGRILANEPIQARPTSIGYRMRKFIRRHAVSLSVGVFVFVLTLSFAIMMAVLYRGQNRAHARADRETAKVTEINQFLQELLLTGAPEGQKQITILEAVDRASRRLQDGEFSGAPEILSALHRTIAIIYTRINEFGSADEHMRTALRIHTADLPDDQAGLGDLLNDLAWLRFHEGRTAEADSIARIALDIVMRTRDDHYEGIPILLNSLATYAAQMGRFAEAESLHHESIERRRALYSRDDPRLAVALNQLAHLYYQQGRLNEAEQLLREVVEINIRQSANGEPSAQAINNLAVILRAQGKHTDTVRLLADALVRSQRVHGERHLETAQIASNLAGALHRAGRAAEAESLMVKVIDVRREIGGPRHPALGRGLFQLAAIRREAGDPRSAERLLREGIAVMEAAGDEAAAAQGRDQLARLTASVAEPSVTPDPDAQAGADNR